MTNHCRELEKEIGPLLRKHPEAVTVMEIVDLQRVCRHTFYWCRELSEQNKRAHAALVDANMLLEVALPNG